MKQAILVSGDPIAGLTFTGPFKHYDQAVYYQEQQGDHVGGSWIAPIADPVMAAPVEPLVDPHSELEIIPLPVPTESDLKALQSYSSSVRKRGLIERAIARFMLTSLLQAGAQFEVDDGEESYAWTTNVEAAMEDIFAVEICHINVRLKSDDKRLGWIKLVTGNTGWDLISDHTTGALEPLLEATSKYSEQLSWWC